MSWDAQRISTPMKRVRNSRAVGSFLWFYLLGRGREITGVSISNFSDKTGASEAGDRGAIPPSQFCRYRKEFSIGKVQKVDSCDISFHFISFYSIFLSLKLMLLPTGLSQCLSVLDF